MRLAILSVGCGALAAVVSAQQPSAFANFETAPVHPVALGLDGRTLAVCNLPDGRVELFDVSSGVPQPMGDVPVGVDPVSVRWHTTNELWVVNHLSSSLSVVDVARRLVVATMQTKWGPADLVFAGAPVRGYFLTMDAKGRYSVFVPAPRRDSAGTSWASGTTAGSSIAIEDFFIARPGDSAKTINRELDRGRHLIFTPGIYHLDRTLKVMRAHTVVLGLGYPTLIPDGGVVAMTVADVAGVKLAGLLFDAGTVNSPLLLRVGGEHRHRRHDDDGNSERHGRRDDPSSLQDVFFRIGGAGTGKATTSLVVNSDDVLIDHVWAWRADHGIGGVGWTVNTADTGLVVNGDDVTAYGLFVEHYQKEQLVWNGENGRTIFFQNEMPYDPPNQDAWMNGTVKGYAAYKVADSVKVHEAWGLGSYCFFNTDPTIHAARSFEVPVTAGVRLHDLLTVSLGGIGTIDHVVNDTGAAAQGPGTVPVNVVSFP